MPACGDLLEVSHQRLPVAGMTNARSTVHNLDRIVSIDEGARIVPFAAWYFGSTSDLTQCKIRLSFGYCFKKTPHPKLLTP